MPRIYRNAWRIYLLDHQLADIDKVTPLYQYSIPLWKLHQHKEVITVIIT